MDDSFFAYIQLVELLAFFSAYPLLYALITVYARRADSIFVLKNRLASKLSYAYALVGTLYLALQLKNLYPDYSISNIKGWIHSPWIVTWALLSLSFWIPALAKRTILSLLHSLVFVFFIFKHLFIHFYNPDNYIMRNDMKVFTYSLMINIAAMILVMLFSFFLARYRGQSRLNMH